MMMMTMMMMMMMVMMIMNTFDFDWLKIVLDMIFAVFSGEVVFALKIAQNFDSVTLSSEISQFPE